MNKIAILFSTVLTTGGVVQDCFKNIFVNSFLCFGHFRFVMVYPCFSHLNIDDKLLNRYMYN